MRMILGPTIGPLDDEALLEAYPWPADRPWLRAMMVTTLDGAAAGPDGLSGSISGEADKAVFHTVRRLADAVLVGAGTVRAEGYGPIRARPEDAARRAESGQAAAPRMVIVSGSLDLDWTAPLFTDAALPPLVITTSEARPQPDHAEIVGLADPLEPTALVDALTERGLRRVVCEGGPSLLARLVEAGAIDEADITLSPVITGTATSPRTPVASALVEAELCHVITADHFLMTRYLMQKP